MNITTTVKNYKDIASNRKDKALNGETSNAAVQLVRPDRANTITPPLNKVFNYF